MSKVQKLVKSISWYFRLGKTVSHIAIIAGVILTLLLGGWYLLGDPDPFMLNTIEIGELSFIFNPMVTLEARPALLYAAIMCLFASIAAVVEYLIFDAVCDILEPIQKGQPFQSAVVVQTYRLGWLIIASGVTGIVSDVTLGTLFPKLIDLYSIFVNEHIQHVGYTSDTGDISFLIYALVMFLLSAVFQHGAQLQQLSDETL